MLSNQELKIRGKATLKGYWLMVIAATALTYLLTASGGSSAVNSDQTEEAINSTLSLLSLLLSGTLTYGMATIYLNLARKGHADFMDLFKGFSVYLKTLLLHILRAIFVFLWTLLLIIPGIIAAISYAMAYYIMVENPGMTAMEALSESKAMMRGHKMRFFGLWISFLGWFVLGFVTFGLAFIYVAPYYEATMTQFYLDLKNLKEEEDEDQEFLNFINS